MYSRDDLEVLKTLIRVLQAAYQVHGCRHKACDCYRLLELLKTLQLAYGSLAREDTEDDGEMA